MSTAASEVFARDVERSACRLLHFGIGYDDLRRGRDAGSWPAWSAQLEAAAERLATLARRAQLRGRLLSARDCWLRAAAYFHYAAFKLADGVPRDELQAHCRRAYAEGAGLLEPPAHPFGFSFANHRFPGYLRVARSGAPCVLLVNGLDSVKEVELSSFAEGFLSRGCSVYYFDGPGQGEALGSVPITQFGRAVSAAIDALSTVLGQGPFGIFGVSFGGYLACQAIAEEPRLKACVSLGGFFDGRIVPRLPPPALARLCMALGVSDRTPPGVLTELIDLKPLGEHLDRPLLVVYGTSDHLVDREQVDRLTAWAAPCSRSRTIVFADSEHVCSDRFSEALPAVWDWLRFTLLDVDERLREVAS